MRGEGMYRTRGRVDQWITLRPKTGLLYIFTIGILLNERSVPQNASPGESECLRNTRRWRRESTF